jgi:beta-lactamase regulating signal transducer with metallopeptidase domain
MISPYCLRLLWLCFASFFLLNVAFGTMVCVSVRRAIRISERLESKTAAQLLLAIRMLPTVVAAVTVLLFCIPSYLLFEPDVSAETVGPICMVLGFLGATTWMLSVGRATRAIITSRRQICELKGGEIRLPLDTFRALVVDSATPIVALTGLLCSRLIISRSVLQSLSREQIDVVLRHEDAHRIAGDNRKRLLLLLLPDIFPFLRAFSVLEHNWAKYSEWAADDIAAGGDRRCAITLAESLIRIARLGITQRLSVLNASLVASETDLCARIERLLHANEAIAVERHRVRRPMRRMAISIAVVLAIATLSVRELPAVHRLLEILIR